MDQQSVKTSDAPQVFIDEIHGSLQVKGWDRSEVFVKAKPDDLTNFEAQEDLLHLSCQGDCTLRLPVGAAVQVGSVHGGGRFKMLENKLRVEKAFGDLSLRNVGETQLGSVNGNLLIKQAGDLQVEQALGNVIARDIQGECSIQQISGNLDLEDASGPVTASANGHVRLRLSILTGDHYRINAGGNIQCRVPGDASLRVELSSSAQNIQVKLPEGKQIYKESAHSLTLGSGDAEMELSASGSISFVSQEVDWSETENFDAGFGEDFAGISEEFAEQIETQIESQMEVLNEQMADLSESLGKTGLSQAEMDRLMQRVRQSSEKATTRAQEKMRRAQEKLERKLAAAQRKAELKAKAAERRSQARGRHSWNFEWKVPPASSSTTPSSAQEPKEPVSDEERLMILRMLEQKKISLEEAEQLLAALEGK
jgi:hypothetical protein